MRVTTTCTGDDVSFLAAGYFPSQVRAVCDCGWSGPYRDMNDAMERVRVDLDAAEHVGSDRG